MSEAISLPLWLVILLALSALTSLWYQVIVPVGRVLLSRRERRINQRLSNELSRNLPEIFKIRRKTRIELFLNKPAVQQAITECEEANEGTRDILQARATAYANELIPGFYALFYFKIGYFLARTYIRIMYSVRVARQPSEQIAKIPQDASIIMVGNHRSNMDVMILAYLAARTNMISFAAGEWGKAWPMSAFLHMCGSYIIRRQEGGTLYRKILAIHMQEMIKAKMPQGIFLEGGLTRDGRIQPMKLGLLSYILSSLGKNNVSDIVFVPVAFNYDQVPEDRTLIKHEERGFQGRSKLYTLFSALNSLLQLSYKKFKRGKAAFGNAAVSFGEPVSMNKWLAEHDMRADELDHAQRRALVAPVAEEIMARIKPMIPVLPVSIIAAVFSAEPDAKLTELEIQIRANQLINQLKTEGAELPLHANEDGRQLIDGIERMKIRKILIEEGGYYCVDPDHRALCHYLYNSISHLIEDK